MADYKVEHDRPTCVGTGNCAMICSDFWEMQKDGKSMLRGGKNLESGWTELEVEEKDFECNKKAADSCPVNAIHITNIKTGEKII